MATTHEAKTTLIVGSALAAASWLVACADVFGIPPSEPAGAGAVSGSGGSATAGGHAGNGGTKDPGGMSAAGGRSDAGGGADGDAGGSGAASDAGTSGTQGTSDAGTSGTDGTSDAGAAGIGGASEWPANGDLCSVKGLSACPGPRATRTLLCNGNTWEPGTPCEQDQRCNRRTGQCADLWCDPGNPSAVVTCREGPPISAQVCGPDYVSFDYEDCAFACRPFAGCVEPGDDQVYVDRPRNTDIDLNFWPGPLIPVCLQSPADWSPLEIEIVKDAFYRSWGRHLGIALTSFRGCEANAEGVTLEIADACDVELARIPITGYPGPSATVAVTLCRAYLDSSGELHPFDADLFRHAAVHVFGHILGEQDEIYSPGYGTVMMGAIDVVRFRELDFPEALSERTQNIYGVTPVGSLSGPSGRCLAWSSSSDSPVREGCDGSPERTFRWIAGRIEHVASGKCLQVTAGDAVGLGDCESGESWQARRVEWRIRRACIGVSAPFDASRPLGVKPCTPRREENRLWSFQFPAPERARISLFRDERCVRWPSPVLAGSVLELGACDGQSLFETIRGHLSVAGRCPSIGFAACNDAAPRYALSGPIETLAGALTAIPNGDAIELRVTPLGETPTEDQIFDYYF